MQYSNFNMKNNVHATLSTAISSVATTIQLTSGQGSRFGTTFPQIATLESIENGKVMKREIVKITGRSGDNLTVVRAFAPCPSNDDANSQTQTSISFNADDTISLYIPKEIFDIISDSLNDIYDNGTNNMRTQVVSGLQVQVNEGSVLVGSAYYDFAGGTITLTDNATNYLEIDEDGLLANNTTGRNDENTKLAIITTSGGSVTNIKDRRLGTIGGKIGGVNIHDLTEKTFLSQNDEFLVADSENIYNNKKVTLENLEKSLNFNGLNEKKFPIKSDIVVVGDSEDSFKSKKTTINNLLPSCPMFIPSTGTLGFTDDPNFVPSRDGSNARLVNGLNRALAIPTTFTISSYTHDIYSICVWNGYVYAFYRNTQTARRQFLVVRKAPVSDFPTLNWTTDKNVNIGVVLSSAKCLGMDDDYFYIHPSGFALTQKIDRSTDAVSTIPTDDTVNNNSGRSTMRNNGSRNEFLIYSTGGDRIFDENGNILYDTDKYDGGSDGGLQAFFTIKNQFFTYSERTLTASSGTYRLGLPLSY